MNWRNILQSKNSIPQKRPPFPPTQAKKHHSVSFLKAVGGIGGRIWDNEESHTKVVGGIGVRNQANENGHHHQINKCRNLRNNLQQPTKNSKIGNSGNIRQPARKIKSAQYTNTIWLDEHVDELLAAGFSKGDIEGTRYVKGIAELRLWKKPGLTVKLIENQLCFTWKNETGQQITQRCRPERKPEKEMKDDQS